ncbi:unnamed protein product [Nesidiocoris tenuis]|uniref:Uncharacterized protein n=1 Tax=Nesidiocoris tenuis TaxID=355587 RepID=A0A6H5HA99_9HEMI|nr:unnamed protein product [Nesidiocoris tenuis]
MEELKVKEKFYSSTSGRSTQEGHRPTKIGSLLRISMKRLEKRGLSRLRLKNAFVKIRRISTGLHRTGYVCFHGVQQVTTRQILSIKHGSMEGRRGQKGRMDVRQRERTGCTRVGSEKDDSEEYEGRRRGVTTDDGPNINRMRKSRDR